MSQSALPVMIAEDRVRYGLAHGGVLLALLVAGASGLGPRGAEVITVLVAGLCCVGLPMGLTTATGVAGWAMVTGFFVNDYGRLTLAADDVVRLLLVAACTVLVARLPGVLGHGRSDAPDWRA